MLLVRDAFWDEPWGGTLLAASEFPTSNHFLSYKLKQLEYFLVLDNSARLNFHMPDSVLRGILSLNPHLSHVRLMLSIESPPPLCR